MHRKFAHYIRGEPTPLTCFSSNNKRCGGSFDVVLCIEPPNHVHCIWDCGYIPQYGLADVWETVTGDSFVVYIRRVDKQRWRGAVNYITKYIVKISETDFSEMRTRLRGKHVVGSWGGWGCKKMRMVCKKCGSYFHPLWDLSYSVDEYVEVEFIEIDPG